MNESPSKHLRVARWLASVLFAVLVPVAVLGTAGTSSAARLLEAWLCDCGSAHTEPATQGARKASCCSEPQAVRATQERPGRASAETCGQVGSSCCCSAPDEGEPLPPVRALAEGQAHELGAADELRRDLERSDATPCTRDALPRPSIAFGAPCRPRAGSVHAGGRASSPRTSIGSQERLALLCTSRT